MVCIDSDHSDVRARIDSDDLSRELALVGERDFHFCSIVDDVAVRQNVSTRIHDDAGAQAAFTPFARYVKLTHEFFSEKSTQKVLVEPSRPCFRSLYHS